MALQRLVVGGITAHFAAILRFSAATRLPRGDVDCQKLCDGTKHTSFLACDYVGKVTYRGGAVDVGGVFE